MTERMTAAKLRQMRGEEAPKADKRRVRGTEPTKVDGIKFDSKREAARYVALREREAAGEISELELQVQIPLFGRDGPILTPTARTMTYRADFRYRDHTLGGILVIEDAKGWATDVYKIKKAILAAQGVEVAEV